MDKNGFKELRYAIKKTVPVMAGYLFLGTAYGILMNVNGFGIWWVLAMSLFVFAGSLQYVGVTLLAGAVNPVYAFFVGFMINARHLFYGISMLNQYKAIKKFKPYLIFALTDETFSILCHEETPAGLNRDQVFFWIALLDQCYWVLGSAAGSLLGDLIPFNTKGLDFALTALFVVIFTEQWLSAKDHGPAVMGVALSAACLIAFGAGGAVPGAFIIPAMFLILAWIFIGYLGKSPFLRLGDRRRGNDVASRSAGGAGIHTELCDKEME